RGRVFESTGEIDIAIDEYKKAIELGADYADIHNSLGRAYAKRGNFDEAKKSFQRALEINPHYLEAQRNLIELETRLALLAKSQKIQKITQSVSQKESFQLERKKSYIKYFVLTVIVLIAIFVFPKLFHKEEIKIYSIPSENISGISTDGKNIWLCDWFRQEIYQTQIDSGNFVIKKTYKLNNVFPVSLSADKNFLWSCDAWSKKINKHIYDEKLSVIESYSTPGNNPSAICWDGKNLWSSDIDTNRIYRHNMSSPEIKPDLNFKSACSRPIGFFYDSGYYWSVDGDKQIIYKHNSDMNVVKKYQLDFGERKVSGVLIDKKYIWITFEGESQIVRYPKKILLKHSSW
ncbi:MAG: tetratricopeptide repeat protein, partial [Endomicrobiia bacterium]